MKNKSKRFKNRLYFIFRLKEEAPSVCVSTCFLGDISSISLFRVKNCRNDLLFTARYFLIDVSRCCRTDEREMDKSFI